MEASRRLGSPSLALVAVRAQADPFKKVKKLIQELIEKLVTEAADEATKKGWCDTEMGKAESSRKVNMERIKILNAETANLEAVKAKLEEDVQILTSELSDLNSEFSKQMKVRTTEKAESMATIDEAKAGLSAVKDAYDVLKSFYKGAAKGKVSLVQQPAGANKGHQGQSASILGMLEVIISDFKRTIKVTTKAEKEMKREFTTFERATKTSIATKETAKSNNESTLKETTTQIEVNMTDLDKHVKLLDAALKELEDLKPSCVDTGMSYEEKVQKRKEEQEALKEALCQLDTDKVEDECQ